MPTSGPQDAFTQTGESADTSVNRLALAAEPTYALAQFQGRRRPPEAKTTLLHISHHELHPLAQKAWDIASVPQKKRYTLEDSKRKSQWAKSKLEKQRP